ncbi:uncharacterized protein C2845_PM11G04290 [Panicum miliaceum]|uniref:No apical meristem-associated C-terminal domain-containing protein n=1 Tax=Panicum miliaceum TaxID=4540 RepID=A0A3L6RPP9_PANMI|nr:uncharacterized protein C2845_PM11G04290 [Panicum miliaceum]
MKKENAPVVSFGDGSDSSSQARRRLQRALYKLVDGAADRVRARRISPRDGGKIPAPNPLRALALPRSGNPFRAQHPSQIAPFRHLLDLIGTLISSSITMSHHEKQAAVAARELLDAAAAQARKGAASAGKRKASTAPPPRKGIGHAATAAEAASEVNGAGFFTGAAASPTNFANGSNFFTGAWAGTFFNSPGHSPMAQPWMHPQSSDPATWDNDPTPAGGFTNFIQPQLSQNFHFVGGPSHYAPFKAPRPMDIPPAQEQTAVQNNQSIDVDSGDEVVRTEKRILWSQAEDVRLMSSWLLNSTDPTVGADRKNEQYWDAVIETYNETTPSERRRNVKQAKDRWHKINRWTDLFHSAWLKARRIYTSGHSDQMWIDKAQSFYEEDNKLLKLGRFVLMDVWYAVRNEAKWITYNNGPKEARKRKSSGKESTGDDTEPVDLEDMDEQKRPMGQKQAKKLAREKAAKEKEKAAKDSENENDELHMYGKIQSEGHADRLKVLEVQQKLSAEKLESAKIAHLAAKEQKEAKKLEVQARMFDTYNRLLAQDITLMSDEEKTDHVATMKCLKKKLFAE